MTPAKAPTVSGAGPSDAALVVAARAGEHWATEALFHRYVRTVNRLALRLMGRDVDVDDLVPVGERGTPPAACVAVASAPNGSAEGRELKRTRRAGTDC